MTVASRIDDLRRRVNRDPASIAFAHLAEEHRRNGDCEEAIRVARAGLAHLPGYLSARVTLGRALLQLGQVDDARVELESVLAAAPDNLAAVRTLAEIHASRNSRPSAPALAAAGNAVAADPETAFADGHVDPAPVEPAAPAATDEVTAFLDQLDQFADDGRTAPGQAHAVEARTVEAGSVAVAEMPSPDARAAETLERWLAAIVANRAARG